MPGWPKDFEDQAKMMLDDSALPMEQYQEVLDEWSKGEYENNITGITRSLADLQNMIARRVCESRGLKMPNYTVRAKLLASRQ
jgi:hypothetical protein